MRHQDVRKTEKALRKIFAAHNIKFERDEGGPGSHRSWLIEDGSTKTKARLVLAGGKEISPGVQRGMLDYLGGLAVRVVACGGAHEFYEFVKNVLEDYFKGN